MQEKHKELLQHMLGADSRYKKKMWGFRNHFAATPGTKDCIELEEMEKLGLVTSGIRGQYKVFWATKKGAIEIGFKNYQLINAHLI